MKNIAIKKSYTAKEPNDKLIVKIEGDPIKKVNFEKFKQSYCRKALNISAMDLNNNDNRTRVELDYGGCSLDSLLDTGATVTVVCSDEVLSL